MSIEKLYLTDTLNAIKENRYFESYSYFEQYKHAIPEVPDELIGEITNADELLESMIRTNKYVEEHPAPLR